MYRVGITGGIGSGKSLICRVFKSLGVPVFTADMEASICVNSDEEIANKLIDKFGKDIYIYEGMVDRSKLAEIMFTDKNAMQYINSIVHPAVMKRYDEWCTEQNVPYIIIETAILFESGISSSVDSIVAVSAPLSIRVKRTMERDRISEADVLLRVNNQMNDDEKQKRADYIIYNNDMQLVIPQILNLHNLFLAKEIINQCRLVKQNIPFDFAQGDSHSERSRTIDKNKNH